MASLRQLLHNRNFRNALQVLSLAIICCTLVIYQVTSAVKAKNNELYIVEVPNNSVVEDDTQTYSNHPRANILSSTNNNNVNKRAIAEQSTNSHINNQVQSNSKPLSTASVVTFRSSHSKLIVDNLFLSVKSTKRFHQTRLKPILKTWFNFAKEQVMFSSLVCNIFFTFNCIPSAS